MITIPEIVARRNAILDAAEALPRDLNGDVLAATWNLDIAILAQPAASHEDLEIKLEIWTDLISDPPSILDQHVELWRQLKADIRQYGLSPA